VCGLCNDAVFASEVIIVQRGGKMIIVSDPDREGGEQLPLILKYYPGIQDGLSKTTNTSGGIRGVSAGTLTGYLSEYKSVALLNKLCRFLIFEVL
jgi:hypothetical protein